MSLAAQRILVIGGGFSGMSAAIECAKLGAAVDLVEIDPEWRNYGAGISLGGATLRAFRRLGVLDAFLERGSAQDGVSIRLPHGLQVAQLPTPRLAGPDVPGVPYSHTLEDWFMVDPDKIAAAVRRLAAY